MKRKFKIGFTIFAILVMLACIFFTIDLVRVQNQKKPLFCINLVTYRDGGTKEYYGFGYKVIAFNILGGYNEFKIGSWFMNASDFRHEYKFTTKSSSITGVVVKVSQTGLMVMNTDTKELIHVGFTDKGNIGFKQAQEVLIYFDGTILATYPAQLGNVSEIAIVKEKSEISIPLSILRYCYSSHENVTITIQELTHTGIILAITDTNEFPYSYSHDYLIQRKVKNETYTGVGYPIGEDTKNSTSGFTRNRSFLSMGRST